MPKPKTKKCSKCKKTQPVANFCKNAKQYDGLYIHCRACKKIARTKQISRWKDKKSLYGELYSKHGGKDLMKREKNNRKGKANAKKEIDELGSTKKMELIDIDILMRAQTINITKVKGSYKKTLLKCGATNNQIRWLSCLLTKEEIIEALSKRTIIDVYITAVARYFIARDLIDHPKTNTTARYKLYHDILSRGGITDDVSLQIDDLKQRNKS